MDRKVMAMIDAEIRNLPPPGDNPDRQYVNAKTLLGNRFPGYWEYIGKAVAEKYNV